MDKEILIAEIPGYPNYLIYSTGQVWSKKNNKFLRIARDGRGYNRVDLQFKGCNGDGKQFSVHRLAAIAFIPNPDNKPQVNHLDGNKDNNDISNLEWATNKENMRHGFDSGLITISAKLREVTSLRSSRKAMDTSTNIIYPSIKAAAKAIGINHETLYCKMARGRNNTSIVVL